MNSIKEIKTEPEHKKNLMKIDELLRSQPKKGSAQYSAPDVIGTIVAPNEDIHFPI